MKETKTNPKGEMKKTPAAKPAAQPAKPQAAPAKPAAAPTPAKKPK